MRWETHFALAQAGQHVLYLLFPDGPEPVWVERSMETGEPVRWILLAARARSWLRREAGLSETDAGNIERSANQWWKLMYAHQSLSSPGAKVSGCTTGACGQ